MVFYPKLTEKCLFLLRKYADMRILKKKDVAKYTDIGHTLIKKRVLKCLQSETELQRRCKFMTLRQKGGLKMRCMGALRDHAER